MCLPLSMWKMLLVTRVLIACLISTSGPPDEYWQGPEVAYYMVYGKGELTWEWHAGIRGYLHPTMYAVLFQALKITGLDSRATIRYGPKILHGVLTFVGDIYTVKLSEKWYPDKVNIHQLTLAFCVVNWFVCYCTTRTLSNSVEAVVSVVAMNFYDDSRRSTLTHKDPLYRYCAFLMFAGLSCAIRPTAAVLWLPCVIRTVINTPLYVVPTVTCVVFWLTETTCIDFLASGSWGISQLRFFEFNFLEGKSAVFGTHPWHWYFTQGFPAMMGTMLPFFVISIRAKLLNPGTYLTIWGLVVYSLIGHKEFRFVLPLLYLAMPGTAAGYDYLCRSYGQKIYSKGYYLVVVMPNIIAAIYFGLVHQRGTISAITDLSHEVAVYDERVNAFEVERVLRIDSLLPCYQIPGLSYVHGTKITHLQQWNCTPIFSKSGSLEPTEHSLFFEHPVELTEWTYGRLSRPKSTKLLKTFSLVVPQPRRMPQFFLIYSHNRELFVDFFKRADYFEYREYFHTLTPFEEGTSTHVLVYKRNVTALEEKTKAGIPFAQ